MKKDYFAAKAGTYEQTRSRVDNVASIADAISDEIRLEKSMHIMDFGSGTGLLLERIAPYVGKIMAVDVSEAMNGELREKLSRLACEVEILPVDLERVDIDRQFDGIVSSMTMHHIENVAAMFGKFRRMLKHGGFIAIADLDQEDGTFHSEDTGIHHFGFVRAAIAKLATEAEFERVHTRTASMIRKDERDYPVFLLTAVRS
jgi:cyclopropane fatty-acyl-phospholipid synthase-like methyltransferase